VGYQEWFAHFEGKLTKEATLAEIQKNSRRYAKRQMTWFQKRENKPLEMKGLAPALKAALELLL